jgi:14-3-3 protein epsilon
MAQPNLEGLSLHDEEEEGFCFDFEEEEEDDIVDLRWCLIGRFLCERTIHFNSMKVRMADLWKPVKGVTIKETKAGTFLFHFAHPLDMEAVINGGPWTFDNNMLLLERVQLGRQIEQIPLFHTTLWVQVHNLPMGLMKERVGIGLANYIGSFVEYDKNNNSSFWRQYMRIRVKIDVRKPLKKNYRVQNHEGEWCTVNFKYEKLGIFCFVCGIMGHAENKCEVRFSMEQDDGSREWSVELRAEPRRQGGRMVSRWLREEHGGRNEQYGRGGVASSNNQAGSSFAGPTEAELDRNHSTRSSNPHQPTFTTRQDNLIILKEKQPHQSIFTTNSQLLHNHSDPSYHQLSHITNPHPTSQPINHGNLNIPFPAKTGADLDLFGIYVQNGSQRNNINIPFTIPKPDTTTIKQQLLPIQPFVFNSQPTHVDQPKLTDPVLKNIANPTQPQINPPIPDPKTLVPRPDKKSKHSAPKKPMTRNSLPKKSCHEPEEEMEVQGEKKRRREEEKNHVLEEQNVSEHFLTAGPGSQDCRDQ